MRGYNSASSRPSVVASLIGLWRRRAGAGELARRAWPDGIRASPLSAVDDAAMLLEPGGDEGDPGSRDALNLLDEADGVVGQLLKAPCVSVLDTQVVGEGERDVGGRVERCRPAQQIPLE